MNTFNKLLATLPTDPMCRHRKLDEIMCRLEAKNIRTCDILRSLWKAIRKTATQEDYETLYCGSLVKEYEINQARLLGLSEKPWKKAAKNIRIEGVTPDGKRTDIIDGGIKRDIDELGYTLFAQPVPEGGTDGYMGTLGLPEILGHPNLLIEEPQDLEINAIVLCDLAEMIKAGKVFQHGEWVNNILEGRLGFTVRLFRVKNHDPEYFRVGFYDPQGDKSVRVTLSQKMIDAMRQKRQKK